MNHRKTAALFGGLLMMLQMPALPCSAEAEPKLIALTFDDGPNNTTTNEVLDVLEQYNAKASFFLIGDNINDESAVSVKRAYDMGCEIDNHSKTHSNMAAMDADKVKAEIAYVDEWVEQITGEKTRFFRPPFIDVSDALYDAVGLPFICGIDCQDYMENVTAQQRADYIMNGAKDGVIVLLHDAAGNSQTVEALKIVMPQLVEQGYEFVTLTELFARQNETPREHILYSRVAKYPCSGYTLHKTVFSGNASGDQSAAVWQDAGVLDAAELEALGSSFAIEVKYSGANQPVLNLQRWSGTAIWHSVQPAYFNGDTACFLAEDILEALDTLGVGMTELDRLGIAPYSGSMEMTSVSILVKGGGAEALSGDVNADGARTVADAVMLAQYLAAERQTLPDAAAADLDGNSRLNAVDLTLLKRLLMQER